MVYETMEPKIPLKPENIRFLIIHHSATPRDFTSFQAIKNYHINQRGFWDIGYHFFINGKGVLYHGRPVEYVGAHTKTPPPSMNFRSLGIALAGNFEKEEPNPEQLATLRILLKSLCRKYKIPPENVLGHRQVPQTATLCPGINLLIWLDHWRAFRKSISLDDIKKKLAEISAKIKELYEKIKRLSLKSFL